MSLNPGKHRIIGSDYERTHPDLNEAVKKKESARRLSTSGCIGVLAVFGAMSTEVMSTEAVSTEAVSTDQCSVLAFAAI
jgi:hypothetical protein